MIELVDRPNKYINVIIFVSVIAAYVSPLFFIMALLIVVPQFNKNKINLSLVGLLLCIFVLININSKQTGDFIWYISQYKKLADGDFSEMFATQICYVKPRLTEPFYYLYAMILSIISGGNVVFYVTFITATIYLIHVYALIEIGKYLKIKYQQITQIILFSILFGITFTLTNHLIRQCLASSLALLAIAMLLEKRYYWAAPISVIAVMTHNSVVIPLLCFGSAVFVNKISSYRLRFSLPALVSLPFIFKALITYLNIYDIESVGMKDDGSVSNVLMLIDFGMILAGFLFYSKNRNNSQFDNFVKLRPLLLFSLLYMVVIMSVSFSPLLSLRLYFFMDIIRWISFAAILASLPARFTNVFLIFIVLISGVYVVDFRMERSPFHYQAKMSEYVFAPVSKLATLLELH